MNKENKSSPALSERERLDKLERRFERHLNQQLILSVLWFLSLILLTLRNG
ncbi:MAG: hypothetical protein LUG65_03910 [Clostridiales bacterium]|nr:hypothetical protein [Clostridiales bacterium]